MTRLRYDLRSLFKKGDGRYESSAAEQLREDPMGLRAGSPAPERDGGEVYPSKSVSGEPAYSEAERELERRRGAGVNTAGSNAAGTSSEDTSRGGASANGESGAASDEGSDDGYDLDAGLSDFYNKLYNKLRAYGVTSIPTFSALYGLFESFLRPSIDAAIAARNSRERANKAELDADAYARGMGGSSYISSMKDRESSAASSDIMQLEGQYSASMAEYLYKALSAMQDMESELERTRMTIAAQREAALIAASARASSGSGSAKSSSSGSKKSKSSSSSSSTGGDASDVSTMRYGHTKKGAYFDGVWYEGDFSYLSSNASYNDYAKYLKGLSASERYLFFTSDQRTWRMRRWQIQYNMPQIDYADLYREYMTGSSSQGRAPSVRKGAGKGGSGWTRMPY